MSSARNSEYIAPPVKTKRFPLSHIALVAVYLAIGALCYVDHFTYHLVFGLFDFLLFAFVVGYFFFASKLKKLTPYIGFATTGVALLAAAVFFVNSVDVNRQYLQNYHEIKNSPNLNLTTQQKNTLSQDQAEMVFRKEHISSTQMMFYVACGLTSAAGLGTVFILKRTKKEPVPVTVEEELIASRHRV